MKYARRMSYEPGGRGFKSCRARQIQFNGLGHRHLTRFHVRPAWARSWRCKSSRKLTTANEAKCNCVRATERGKEARSETANRWTRTGYKAMPSRASGHDSAKLSWSRLRRRKSGGCAGKDRALTWGDLVLRLKGRRGDAGREVSKGRSSRRDGAKGRTRRRVNVRAR
jgi:hypothetical protein